MYNGSVHLYIYIVSVSMTLVVHGSFSKEGVNSFSIMALHTVIQKNPQVH